MNKHDRKQSFVERYDTQMCVAVAVLALLLGVFHARLSHDADCFTAAPISSDHTACLKAPTTEEDSE